MIILLGIKKKHDFVLRKWMKLIMLLWYFTRNKSRQCFYYNIILLSCLEPGIKNSYTISHDYC